MLGGLQQEQNFKEDHMTDFMENDYPGSFIHSSSAAKPPREHDGEEEEDRPNTVHLQLACPECVQGLQDQRCVQARLLCSLLTEVPPYGVASNRLRITVHLQDKSEGA